MKLKNNKKIQYLLVLLVIIVWGLVIRQLNEYQAGTKTNIVTTTALLPINTHGLNKKDSFQLIFDYVDPFLTKGNFSTLQANTTNSSNKRFQRSIPSTPSKQQKDKSSATFPNIQYKGYSNNQQQAERVFLQVDGQSIMLQAGTSYKDIRILDLQRDSITVAWKKEQRVIKREK